MAQEPSIDERVFTEWVRAYGPELRQYCLRLTGGRRALADEILQSAFSVAWTKRGSFKGGNSRAWLYCIVRHQGLWRMRREGRSVEMGPEGLRRLIGSASGTDNAPDPERLQEMKACFGKLSAVDQTIIELAYGLRRGPEEMGDGGKLTYAEIGRVLAAEHGRKLRPDGVRMRLKRALATLLREMSNG